MNCNPGNEANLKNSWPRLSEKFPFGLKDFSTEIYFIFLKNILDQTSKAFNTKYGSQWKHLNNSYQVEQILALFCKLVTLVLG